MLLRSYRETIADVHEYVEGSVQNRARSVELGDAQVRLDDVEPGGLLDPLEGDVGDSARLSGTEKGRHGDEKSQL